MGEHQGAVQIGVPGVAKTMAGTESVVLSVDSGSLD